MMMPSPTKQQTIDAKVRPVEQRCDALARAWIAAALDCAEWPLVPVCMYCQRVASRDAAGVEHWSEVSEATRISFRSRTLADHLTHGMCPSCLHTRRSFESPRRQAAFVSISLH